MLALALALLCAAAAVGAGMAVRYLRGRAAKPPAAVTRAAHATLGASSLAALLLALSRGLPPTHMGTGGFAVTTAVLLGLALLFGLRLAILSWRRRRPSEGLVGTHAGFAVAALVLLLALVSLG